MRQGRQTIKRPGLKTKAANYFAAFFAWARKYIFYDEDYGGNAKTCRGRFYKGVVFLMKRIILNCRWLGILLLTALILSIGVGQAQPVAEEPYARIVVLGDPHLPYKPSHITEPTKQVQVITAKNNVLDDINSWDDVTLVAAVGDIVGETGSSDEYEYARQYFARLNKPLTAVVGNHDYIYSETRKPGGYYFWAEPEVRRQKLTQFKNLFSLSELYYSRRVGNCLLVFLSPDMLSGNKYYLQYSPEQLLWLESELAKQPNVPAIVFTHAPLQGTLLPYSSSVDTAQNIAQPYEAIKRIIKNHPQLFLWVSGHMHVPPTNLSYNHVVNRFANQVTNIHNSDMDREIQWTNSLYIYSDRVVVRTFNHYKKEWLDDMERVIPIPMPI